LNHASLLDGARLSGAKLYRYRHLDYNHLEKLLSQHRGNFQRAIILSESIFSMDGDLVDLTKLVEVKKRHDAWLYIDEAHALGVRGPQGLGLCEEQNLIPQIDLILATFGKALASLGAFVAGDRVIINYLVNKMRPFIFTTALPPIIVCWNLQLLQQLPEFKGQRIHLRQLALRLRTAFQEAGLSTLGDSQIVPLITGESHRAITVAEKLKENGFLLFPIRPPTVPVNTSRLRISLTANLEWDDVKDLPGIAAQALQEGKDTP
ncbi:aminotransferase class I/II-fold pyridoxal phosphate-dependent enzyme, partial [bacterium]|nr:aminotransferase class I/II-fold pyridoxal phosphate-dependent enzyme [bacterium]